MGSYLYSLPIWSTYLRGPNGICCLHYRDESFQEIPGIQEFLDLKFMEFQEIVTRYEREILMFNV